MAAIIFAWNVSAHTAELLRSALEAADYGRLDISYAEMDRAMKIELYCTEAEYDTFSQADDAPGIIILKRMA